MYQPGHTYSVKTLGGVYAGLLFLAALMIGFARLPMESLPIDWLDLHLLRGLTILGIAVVMAVIIAGFLMGLFYEKSFLNPVVFGANFAFLLIFLLFVWADLHFRGSMDPDFTKQLNWESPVLKQNASEEPSHTP